MDNGADSYKLFLKGDESGIVRIICEYRQGLILFVNGIVHDLHEAEDITEDTFVRLMVKKPVFSGKSSFKTWLYSIARNLSFDYLKKRKNDIPLTASDFDNNGYVESDVESEYIKEENARRLHDIIKTLPDDYRQVLYLVYFENFDNKSAAKIMKKNKRQMENLIYRAKKVLKKRLMEESFEYEDK